MTELLPCPFCGGEAKLYSVGTGSPHYGHYHQVVCQGCLTASGAYWSGEQSAIDAWNTRYHSEFEKTVIKAWKEIKDYTERTCKNVDEYARAGFFICGNCGFGENGIELTPNYCPSCGAKVTPKCSETTPKVVEQ